MHELSIAMSVVEEAGRILEKEGRSRIISVTLSIGRLSGIEREPLETCFPLAAEGTPCEHAALIIEDMEVEVQCNDCHSRTQVEMPCLSCAKCASTAIEVVQGYELNIKSMEIE